MLKERPAMDDVGQLVTVLILAFVGALLFYWILVRGHRF
jgi:hypothetical protein